MSVHILRDLPEGIEALADLALDLRWTWSHAGDALWRTLDPTIWEQTQNPWLILQNVSRERLDRFAGDEKFKAELAKLDAARREYLEDPGWYGQTHADSGLQCIAYFSLEFGLGEALPLYAGGLGVLAGDYLKAASDLGLPLVGVGLLYQEGYFRQMLDGGGVQQEIYAYNDPSSLPIQPAWSPSGGWLHVSLDLPGRTLSLRLWQASVGRVKLYLLDSNDPLNSPSDRGITSKLYGGGEELRLMQEIVLGVAGWRALEVLGIEAEICHLNEGHAAFALIERARRFMERHGIGFREALWATRAGNIFTTHTPVAAGFDRYGPELIHKYFPYFRDYMARLGISLEEMMALGRRQPRDPGEPVNLAYLALRGVSRANGVSRLHGEVSRRLFQSLYPRWPEVEVPVSHITNGVHMPSWDSPWADEIWTRSCGKDRWLGTAESLPETIECLSDEDLWTFLARERQDLVQYARRRLARQLGQRGGDPTEEVEAQKVLDPNILTLGFARRFTEYKRPNLLLRDPDRLERLLADPNRPAQIIVAGKAHPLDREGKRMIREWAEFTRRPAVRNRAVFLEDYDMVLAKELVQGVDVWINTPRRPWEACGTSGMKVLVNGGLNLSALDGWWAESWSPEVGWALGDGREHAEPGRDAIEADQLYRLLEGEIVPAFYSRDVQGIPRGWVTRMRASMAGLAPRFSSNRMVREYVERMYLPAAAAFRRRAADGARLASELQAWRSELDRHWDKIHIGPLETVREGDRWNFRVPVYLGDISAEKVRVELYADAVDGAGPFRLGMNRGDAILGSANGFLYHAAAPASRPGSDFTPRVIPHHPEASIPIEVSLIHWQN